MLHVEFVFRDNAPIRRARHGWQHRSEPRVASKHFHNEKSLVRSGRGAETISQFNRPADARAKADAIISARHVIPSSWVWPRSSRLPWTNGSQKNLSRR